MGMVILMARIADLKADVFQGDRVRMVGLIIFLP
jgi:hypothetical protein